MMLLTCGMENLELILKIIASEIERTFRKYWRNNIWQKECKWAGNKWNGSSQKSSLLGGYQLLSRSPWRRKWTQLGIIKKDHALISRLMRKIFPHRRQLLIKDLIPLWGLLQQYPMLCSEEQLSLICYLGLFGSR